MKNKNEESIEDNYNQIDGVINNITPKEYEKTRKKMTLDKMKKQAREINNKEYESKTQKIQRSEQR